MGPLAELLVVAQAWRHQMLATAEAAAAECETETAALVALARSLAVEAAVAADQVVQEPLEQAEQAAAAG